MKPLSSSSNDHDNPMKEFEKELRLQNIKLENTSATTSNPAYIPSQDIIPSSGLNKKISIKEKFELLRKQHQQLEEEKLAKVKNDPSRRLQTPQSKVEWKGVTPNEKGAGMSQENLTPGSQGKKVSSLQNKWNAVISESKNKEQTRFDSKKKETISQFRIAQDGIVKKRIGEWEKLFLQSATVEQMETFYQKAQQAMMAKLPQSQSLNLSTPQKTVNRDETVSDAPIVFPSDDAKSEPVFPPMTPDASKPPPPPPAPLQSTTATQSIGDKNVPPPPPPPGAAPSTPQAPAAVAAPFDLPQPKVEDFIINDTKIYNLKEFEMVVQNYLMKCFTLNNGTNRIPLVCGIFGEQKASKPPLDVFAAAIKTDDQSIFIALTVMVSTENELNPIVYGMKKIVIMAKDENSKLIEKILNILPAEGMNVPISPMVGGGGDVSMAPAVHSIEGSASKNNVVQSLTFEDDGIPLLEQLDAEPEAVTDDQRNDEEEDNPDISQIQLEESSSPEKMISPFKGYLEKLFQEQPPDAQQQSTIEKIMNENEPTTSSAPAAPASPGIRPPPPPKGSASSAVVPNVVVAPAADPVKERETVIAQQENQIFLSLDAIEKSNNNQTIQSSIQQLEEIRHFIRSNRDDNSFMEQQEDGTTSDVNQKEAGHHHRVVEKTFNVIVNKLSQCQKWKYDNNKNKEQREVLEVKLLSTLKEMIEIYDFEGNLLSSNTGLHPSSSAAVSASSVEESKNALNSIAAAASLNSPGNRSSLALFKKSSPVPPPSTSSPAEVAVANPVGYRSSIRAQSVYSSSSGAFSSSSSDASLKGGNLIISYINEIIDRLKISIKTNHYPILKLSLQLIEILNEKNYLSMEKIKEILMTLNTLDHSSSLFHQAKGDIYNLLELLNNSINVISLLMMKTEEDLRDEIIDYIITQLKAHGYEFRANRVSSSFDLHKLHTKPADKLRKGYENVKGEGMRNKVKGSLLDILFEKKFLFLEKELYLKKFLLSILLKDCSSWKDSAKSISISERVLTQHSYNLKIYQIFYHRTISAGWFHHLVTISGNYLWEPQYIQKIITILLSDTINQMNYQYLFNNYFLIATEMISLDRYQNNHPNTIVILKNNLLEHYYNVNFDSLLLIPLQCLKNRGYVNHFYNFLSLQYYEFVTNLLPYFEYKFEQFQKLNSKHISMNHVTTSSNNGGGGAYEYLENLIAHEFTNLLLSKFFFFRYPILNSFQALLLDRFPVTSLHSNDSSPNNNNGEGGDNDELPSMLLQSASKDSVESNKSTGNNNNKIFFQTVQQIKNYLNILLGFGLLRYENNYFASSSSSSSASSSSFLTGSSQGTMNEDMHDLLQTVIIQLNQSIYSQLDRDADQSLSYSWIQSWINEETIHYLIDNYYMSTEMFAQSINANYVIESLFNLFKNNQLRIKDNVVDYWIVGKWDLFPFQNELAMTQRQQQQPGNDEKKMNKSLLCKDFPFLFFNFSKLYENPNDHLQASLNEYLLLIKYLQDVYEQEMQEGANNNKKEGKSKKLREIEKKVIQKKIALAKTIIRFVELMNSIQTRSSVSTNASGNRVSVASPTNPRSSLSPSNSATSSMAADVEAALIFENENEDDSTPFTIDQKNAIAQLKESCYLSLQVTSSAGSSSCSSQYRNILITPDYIKTSYQRICSSNNLSFYYRIFYYEFLDYLYFVHHFSEDETPLARQAGKYLGGGGSAGEGKQHPQLISLLIKKSLEDINREYNLHGHRNIRIAFPLPAPAHSSAPPQTQQQPAQSGQQNKLSDAIPMAYYLSEDSSCYIEYFIQILTIELIFSQQVVLENMMESSPSLLGLSGGNLAGGMGGGSRSSLRLPKNQLSMGRKKDSAGDDQQTEQEEDEPSFFDEDDNVLGKFNTIELFAREQLLRLINKLKNETAVTENMCKVSYLPKLVEWAAGPVAKEKMIQGNYRPRLSL